MTFDIYTNRIQTMLLEPDELAQLKAHQGEFQLFNAHNNWVKVGLEPRWYSMDVYRAVYPNKPSINWDHVADEFNAMAMDKDRSTWLYKKMPNAAGTQWTIGVGGGDVVAARAFTSFVPGTCDHWRDSLVIRPGYEGE